MILRKIRTIPLCLLALLGAGGLVAQEKEEIRRAEVITIERGQPVEEVVDWEGDEAQAELADAADAAQVSLAQAKRVQLSLEAGFLYDDNIYFSARDQVSDMLYRASLAARLNWGDALAKEESYLTIGYRPDAYVFQSNAEENSVDHQADASVKKKWARLSVEGAGKYQRTSGGTADLGGRVERDVFQARAGAAYGWGAKTSVYTGLQWDAESFREAGYADNSQWTHEAFVDYQATEKSSMGLGGAWGQLRVRDGSQPQDFQRVLLRARHVATGKIVLRGQAGVEFRDTEISRSLTPVFGLDADYEMTAHTVLRARAAREILASASMNGQNYTASRLSLGATQKLGERFSFALDAGWDWHEYEAARRGAQSQARDDSGFFIRPGLAYAFAGHWTAEAWYHWRSNDSSDSQHHYDVSQAGLNIRYDF